MKIEDENLGEIEKTKWRRNRNWKLEIRIYQCVRTHTLVIYSKVEHLSACGYFAVADIAAGGGDIMRQILQHTHTHITGSMGIYS